MTKVMGKETKGRRKSYMICHDFNKQVFNNKHLMTILFLELVEVNTETSLFGWK